jgi:hypothetical protein
MGKISFFIIFFSLLNLFIMADDIHSRQPTEIYADISLFEVGKVIPSFIKNYYYGSDDIAVSPSQFLPYFLVHSGGITFTVAFDRDQVVRAVFVGHYPIFSIPGELFKTPEGVSVGMSYREVFELIPNIILIKLPVGRNVATLPSEWQIGFKTGGSFSVNDWEVSVIYKDRIIQNNTKDKDISKKTIYWYFLFLLIPFILIMLFLVKKKYNHRDSVPQKQ